MFMADPTLTDEELAKAEQGHEPGKAPFGTPDFCRRCQHYWPCPTFRLILTLRASRQEAERLRECLEPGKASAIVAAMFDEAERLGHNPFSSTHALTYLVGEIERLRGLVNTG